MGDLAVPAELACNVGRQLLQEQLLIPLAYHYTTSGIQKVFSIYSIKYHRVKHMSNIFFDIFASKKLCYMKNEG